MDLTPINAVISSAPTFTADSANSYSIVKEELRGKCYVETTDGCFVLLPDPHEGLEDVQRFMTDVLAGKHNLSLAAPNRRQREAIEQKVRKLLRLLRELPCMYTPGLCYRPEIAFLLDHYRQHDVSQLAGIEEPNQVLPDGRTVTELLKDFLAFLLREAAEERLLKKIRNYEGKIDKNLESLKRWEQGLFDGHARVTFVRLDLDYLEALVAREDIGVLAAKLAFEQLEHKEIYESGESLDGQPLQPVRTSFEQVQADRDKFFANLKGKTSLFEHLIGYVWRIEYARKAGFHLHVVLAFEGHEVRKHEWLAQEIGEYWAKEIAPGRGRFHNCNRAWERDHPRYGIGVINWHDEALRANLREHVLPYLAKRDQRVLAVPSKGVKLVGSSMVRRDDEETRGRPRKARPSGQPPLST